MNSKLYEFLEIWRTRILKNESRTLQIFWNFGVQEFLKNEPELYEFLEIWCMGI